MRIFILLLTTLFFGNNILAQDLLVDTTYRKFNTLVATNSVNKLTERKIKLPNEIKCVSNEQLRLLNYSNSGELLQTSGNLYVRNIYQGGPSPIIRGFEGSRIGMYVDGVRVNNLLFGTNYASNIIAIDPNVLENIEIVNGPSSTIYGSGAMGGVIHLHTKMPELANDTLNGKAFNGNVTARYNTANSGQTYHTDFNFGDGRTAALTSVTYSTFGDLKKGNTANPLYQTKDTTPVTQANTKYNQYNIVEKILFRPEENITHLINLQYSNTSAINNYAQQSETNYALPKYTTSKVGPQKRFLGTYDYNIIADSTFFDKLHVGINIQDVQESVTNQLTNDSRIYNYTDHAQIIGANADFIKQVNIHQIRYGVDAQYNSLLSTTSPKLTIDSTNYQRQNVHPMGGSTMYNTAMYATHTFDINEKMNFSDGLRIGYNLLNCKFFEENYYHFTVPATMSQKLPVFSLNAGLVYLPYKYLKLSGILSTGYRTPNVYDISRIYSSKSGAVIIPNEKMKAEYAYNFDLGTTYWYNDNMWIENTFYTTLLKNALVVDKAQYDGKDTANYYYMNPQLSKLHYTSNVYTLQNVQTGFVMGMSTKVNVSFEKYWQVIATFNYTKGKYSKPYAVPMSHIPPAFAQLTAKFSKGKYTAMLMANYNSLKPLRRYNLGDTDNEQYATIIGTPAWFTLNFSAQVRFNDAFHLQLGVDNILDTQYRTYGSGISASGRNMYACLRINW